MKLAAILLGLVVCGGAVARADIIEWRDAEGVRHFTNSTDEVPTSATPRVVVTERAQPAVVEAASPAPVASAPPRQAQVVYDASTVEDAYVEGLERGLVLARASGENAIQINGPLAIANANRVAPSYPYYEPLITTGFDRGRSRHLTLRMLLEDQFQIDRDGPFLYERLPPGGSINLHPFLARGLPGRVPVGPRVLF